MTATELGQFRENVMRTFAHNAGETISLGSLTWPLRILQGATSFTPGDLAVELFRLSDCGLIRIIERRGTGPKFVATKAGATRFRQLLTGSRVGRVPATRKVKS